MEQVLKCAACGAKVEFSENEALHEAVCPGCSVRVRRRVGDDTMAIPVSMLLPDEFQQVDLRDIVKKGEALQERYRRVSPEKEDPKSATDRALAHALESLATSINHLERKLGDGPDKDADEEVEKMIPVLETEPVVFGNSAGVAEKPPVAGEAPAGKLSKRCSPLQASVLVRREAAATTHRMLKEKNRDRIWTDAGTREDERPGFFALLMEKAPGSTIVFTLLGMIALIVGTIVLMEDSFKDGPEVVADAPILANSSMGQLWEDDPEAAQAEAVARGFLNAVSAEAAKPFVYQSEQIAPRLEKLFKPITSPGEYRLALKSRALTPGGQSIFAFRVWPKGEDSRMLVVLPEGKMPKVQWEFFAEVGELSWGEFMTIRPADAVLMRAWVRPSNTYYPPYTQEDWQAYLIHDYAEQYQVIAYADRGSGADWKLSTALEEDPVKFNRFDAVMAQVELSYMVEMPSKGEDKERKMVIGEIKRVPATSWLPRGYLPSSP